MKWNWQQKDWPNFSYKLAQLQKFEEEFIYNSGITFGAYKHLSVEEQETLKIELIASEALKTSQIEGEILNRDSLQSSIRRNFGLEHDHRKIPPAEKGIADMMSDLYKNFDRTLTHEILFSWHEMITNGRRDLQNIGGYRTHDEPMQIVSGRLDPKIHFEAPPSKLIKKQMDEFIIWFNQSSKGLPAIIRSAITHHYFVSIHPFEDGNGRIARALAIKSLSESVKKPLLTSLSTIIQDKKKDYYEILERNNRSNEITSWIEYFAQTLVESQKYTQNLIDFLIFKTKLYEKLKDNLNDRQKKALQRMFKEGFGGFKGGLSAENYISITKTTRPTATRDLNDLVEKKAFVKTGKLKGSRYHLNLLIGVDG
jgi:Fic family protein